MGRTAGALGSAPTVTVERPTPEDGPAAENGSEAATSAAGDPATIEEGPAAGRRALAHPRPISVDSSSLCHLRILKKSS